MMRNLLRGASWCSLQGEHWPGSAHNPNRWALRVAVAIPLSCCQGFSLNELLMDMLSVHFLGTMNSFPLHLTGGSSLEECTARALIFTVFWPVLSPSPNKALFSGTGAASVCQDSCSFLCYRLILFFAHKQGLCFPNQRLSSSYSKGKIPGWWKMELPVAHV